MTVLTPPSGPAIPEIDVHTLAAWLEAGTAVVIDVREDEEWEEMHMPGVTLLPMSEFEPEDLPDRAGKALVIQCRSGVRSLAVARRLVQREGHVEVYNLTGGILAWQAAGFEVQAGELQEQAA
ncbi:MAG: hypothetical protein VR70_17320 [Rhodospirillaceae bacterium BRH_c57]|nr:MAG: hypothetical protein VR70_17320 [Rhodospirillaceae bacterium BRH_c57]